MGGAVGLAFLSGIAASYTASASHDAARQALTSGYNLAMAVAALFTLLGVVIATVVIRPLTATQPPHERRESQLTAAG
jgi:p-aminobenzoyl-glutamate transporter AbgT